MKLKIITEYIYPPIPRREFDWKAHYEGMEEGGPSGFGKTEQEAIEDLKQYELTMKPQCEHDKGDAWECGNWSRMPKAMADECHFCACKENCKHGVPTAAYCVECNPIIGNAKSLECNCCGMGCRGRQWWNRDTGYGICTPCGEEQVQKYGLAYVEECNGKRGIHWGVKP